MTHNVEYLCPNHSSTCPGESCCCSLGHVPLTPGARIEIEPGTSSVPIRTALTFATLRSVNLTRLVAKDGFDHPLDAMNALEWAGAMCGEAGEAANNAKKLWRVYFHSGMRRESPSRETVDELKRKILKEIGDTIIYADLLAARIGFTTEDAVRIAFNEKSDEIGCSIKL